MLSEQASAAVKRRGDIRANLAPDMSLQREPRRAPAPKRRRARITRHMCRLISSRNSPARQRLEIAVEEVAAKFAFGQRHRIPARGRAYGHRRVTRRLVGESVAEVDKRRQ